MFRLEYKRQLLHTHSDWKTKYGKCYMTHNVNHFEADYRRFPSYIEAFK
jgi:hypothetical protein